MKASLPMSAFARSDVMYVAVSQYDGGCGEPHARPVTEGAPDKVWELACPQCTKSLRSHPLWAGSQDEIPETQEEVNRREAAEKKNTIATQDTQTAVMAEVAKIPQALMDAMNARSDDPNTAALQELVKILLAREVAKDNVPAHLSPGEVVVPGTVVPDLVKDEGPPKLRIVPDHYEELHIAKLKKLARENGMDYSGTKAEVIARLRGD